VKTEPIALTSLVDEIAFRLEQAILEGEFRPGTHLLQDELCARFGVSRTPVREALRKLQAQHLVVLVPNKGATVRFPSQAELHDVYAVRAELEGFACELACHDDGMPQAAMLEALDSAQADIDAAQHLLERGKLRPDQEPAFNARITRANEAFHSAIFDACGNAQLAYLCRSLQGYFPKDYVWRAELPRREARILNIEEHRTIRAALAGRDAPAARRAMSKHVAHGGRVLIDYLEGHGFWD
jgi:DNA-binding GntR family transcriptional regulator